MEPFIVLGTIAIASVVLGCIEFRAVFFNPDRGADLKQADYWSGTEKAPWQWKFMQRFSHILNYFIAGLIGYYFVLTRLDSILGEERAALNVSDFVLFFVFVTCIFGLLPYLLKNITEAIQIIFKRILEK